MYEELQVIYSNLKDPILFFLGIISSFIIIWIKEWLFQRKEMRYTSKRIRLEVFSQIKVMEEIIYKLKNLPEKENLWRLISKKPFDVAIYRNLIPEILKLDPSLYPDIKNFYSFGPPINRQFAKIICGIEMNYDSFIECRKHGDVNDYQMRIKIEINLFIDYLNQNIKFGEQILKKIDTLY